MTVLRAGVVGLGTMGRHHARVLAQLPDVRLVAACDPDPRASAAVTGLPVLRNLDQLLAMHLDVCVVAAPTRMHAAIGARLAKAGVHALIEKPLAATAEEAWMLATAFEEAGLIACVGHIERFNPVIRAMRERIDRGEIGALLQITTSRQGPHPQRIRDVGVILDLASHDVDLTRWIAGSPYTKVSAVTNRVISGSHEDLAAVVGTLMNGTIVNHLVNWLSPLKERLVTVTGERGCLRGDLLAGVLGLCRHNHGATQGPGAAPLLGGQVIPCEVLVQEPLRAELEGFIAAVRGYGDDIVPMRAGAEVMDVTGVILSAPHGAVVSTRPTAVVVAPGGELPCEERPEPGARLVAASVPDPFGGPVVVSSEDQPGLVTGCVMAPGSRRFV